MTELGAIQRSILPIPDPVHVGLTTFDASDPDTKYPSITQLRPPKGAPNILVILIDDCGFGASSAFGGPIATPAATQLLFGGMSRLTEGSLVVTHNKSYSLTAEIEVPKSGANGVIVGLGGSAGGWSLYALNGKLKHCYNFFGIEQFFAEGTEAIPAGKHQVRMEFKYDGGGLAKGGAVSLFVDGKKDGEGRVDMTVPMIFSADETCDVGKETGSPVSPDYSPEGNDFSGRVNWVQIDLEKDDYDHLITPEEKFRVAMARQ